MARILVTGGAGFIGSHFIQHLNNHTVVILDKMTYASDFRRIKAYLGENVKFVEGDICDAVLLKDLFHHHKIDTVVNFAAESHVDRSIKDVSDFIQTNIIGVQTLMDVCKTSWHDSGRFIQISTDEVYGPSSSIHDEPLTEKAPMKPQNPYAATKASAELLIQSYINTYNFPAMIVRCTNVYGWNQHGEKFLPTVMKAVLAHDDIPVYGHGQYYRNWMYVDDACASILHVMKHGNMGEIYNIAGPGLVSNNQVIQMILALFELQGHVYEGNIRYVDDRKGHDLCYLVDDSKLRQSFLMEKTSLMLGLSQIIKNL